MQNIHAMLKGNFKVMTLARFPYFWHSKGTSKYCIARQFTLDKGGPGNPLTEFAALLP
jgi:hypothetical protein